MKLRIGLLILLYLFTSAVSAAQVSAAQYVAGDLAPIGAPDNNLDVADVLIMERFVNGLVTPTAIELLVADVAPVGNPDGILNVADVLVLQRAVLGLVALPAVTTGPGDPVIQLTGAPIDSSYIITGTADAGNEIRLYVNNILQANTLVATDGTFRLYATLDASITNDIYVIASDGISLSNQSNHLAPGFSLSAPVLNNVSGSTTVPFSVITGQAGSGASVKLYNNAVLVDTAAADINGNFTSNIALSTGSNIIYAIATDGVISSPQSTSVNIEYYTTSIVPVLNSARTPTSSNPYTISGKALPNEAVNIYINGSLQTITSSDASGNFDTSITLTTGANNLTVSARSGANETAQSAAITVMYDATFTTTSINGTQSGTPFVEGAVYDISTGITVARNQILDIPAGTELRFSQGAKLTVNGTLNINGTSINPVVLTSVTDSGKAGDWGGIYVNNGSVNINNAVIENAVAGLEYDMRGSGSVTNSHIRNNALGIYAHGVMQLLCSRTPCTNDSGRFNLVINNNNIYANGSNLRLWDTHESERDRDSDNILDVRNNWWGSSDAGVIGKSIEDAADGPQGDVSVFERTYADYLPYLTSLDGPPIAGTPLSGPLTTQTLSVGTYLVSGFLSIPRDEVLTIDAGTVFKFSKGSYLKIDNGATLAANGGANNSVIFTSETPQLSANRWAGIYTSGGTVNINNAVIENAVAGLEFDTIGRGSITNSHIRNNTLGIYAHGVMQLLCSRTPCTNDSGRFNLVINNNNIYANGSNLRLWDTHESDRDRDSDNIFDVRNNWWGSSDSGVIGKSIDDAADGPQGDASVFERTYADYLPYLTSLDGLPIAGTPLSGPITTQTLVADTYLVSGFLNVISNESLTIDAGAVFKFSEGGYLAISKFSTLAANGTENTPVVFTSENNSSNTSRWGGIYTSEGTVNINNAVIENAMTGLELEISGVATITNSHIRNNVLGVYVHGVQQLICDFTACTDDIGQYSLTINSSSIYSNGRNLRVWDTHESGAKPAEDRLFNVRNNWWGSSDSGIIEKSIEDAADGSQGDEGVFDRVYADYLPYLTSLDGSPVAGTPLSGPLTTQTLVAGTYLISGFLSIPRNETLTIDAGAVFKFSEGGYLDVGRSATLTVNGGTNNPVVFTSENPQISANRWAGIYTSGGTVNINNAVIENAVAGLEFDMNGNGSITNSDIRNNTLGIYAHGVQQLTCGFTACTNDIGRFSLIINNNNIYANSTNLRIWDTYESSRLPRSDQLINVRNNWWGSSDTSVIQNSIEDAVDGPQGDASIFERTYADYLPYLTGLDGQPIAGTPILGTLTTQTLTAGRYLVSGQVVVPAGNTLTIEAGAVLKFNEGASLRIDPSATLTVNGVQANPVVFTSLSTVPAMGDWKGIELSTVNYSIDNAVVEYAQTGVTVTSSPSGTSGITNSTFRYNQRGIQTSGLSTNNAIITGNTIVSNNYGIYLISSSAPVITSNTIENNAIAGIYLSGYGSSTVVLDINNNWWGTATPVLGSTNGVDVYYDQTDQSVSPISNPSPVPFAPPIVNLTITGVSYLTTSSKNITFDPATGEQAQVRFTLNQAATVRVRWFTEDTDVLVRDTAQSLAAGTHTIGWDGKDESGVDVVNNAYTFKIYANDGVTQVVYDVPGGGVTELIGGGFDNALNAYTNDSFKTALTVSSPGCDAGCRTKLRITGDNNFIALEDQFEPGSYTVGWNLRGSVGNVITGTNRALLEDMTTLKPNSVIIKNSALNFNIKGTGAFPDIEVKSDPYVVYHSYEQRSKVEYHLDRDATVTVKILPPNITNPDDPSVIVLVPSTLQSANIGGTPYSFTWEGYTDAAGQTNNIKVSEEGAYTYLIEAVSQADGSTALYRGFITMFH